MNELMLMNMPARLARKCGRKARITLIAPRTFNWNCQSMVSSAANSSGPYEPAPALLTTTSIFPNASMAAAAALLA